MPGRSFTHPYPLVLPRIEIPPDLDFLVLELPPRYQPMMPNGLGYLYNALKNADIRFRMIDLNIVMYHRYHSKRILDRIEIPVRLNGKREDPWDSTNALEWYREEVLDYFWPEVRGFLDEIIAARPKAVGLSVHRSNRPVAQRFVKELKQNSPETVIIIGGYDCVYLDIDPWLFPEFDYVVIGEAELTIAPLLDALAKGRRPRDLPGIVSHFDSPNREWKVPIPENLDALHFPRYEWTDLSLYLDYRGRRLVPITASRGCRWGRCRFCRECFMFRSRSPHRVVEEIAVMVARGFDAFHFNESDVNGDPEALYAICTGIIREGLKVKLMGQLRISRSNTAEYMQHLAEAGFKHLRFGVDGWCDRTLRFQRKGYGIKTVFQNLRDSHAAGIRTTVNVVVGVPGETEEDVDETIRNLILCKNHIDLVEALNTLYLVGGSEYFRYPEKYKIRFRGDKDRIRAENRSYVPPDLWYSEEPYIDQDVRLQRLSRVIAALHENGVRLAPFVQREVEILRQKTG